MATRHLVVHAQSSAGLVASAREADFAYEEVGRRLNLPPAEGKAHLFLIEEEGLWTGTVLAAGVRREGLAAHYQDEVFIRRTEINGMARLQIPHEMVHLRLRQAYGQALPLWQEEGLACVLAWETAQHLATAEGKELTRKRPGVPAQDLMDIDVLTSLEAYPEEEAALRAYYCQTEELVRGIAAALGREQLGEWVALSAGEGAAWGEILVDDFNLPRDQLRAIESASRSRSQKAFED
jgi:hypothetical protein